MSLCCHTSHNVTLLSHKPQCHFAVTQPTLSLCCHTSHNVTLLSHNLHCHSAVTQATMSLCCHTSHNVTLLSHKPQCHTAVTQATMSQNQTKFKLHVCFPEILIRWATPCYCLMFMHSVHVRPSPPSKVLEPRDADTVFPRSSVENWVRPVRCSSCCEQLQSSLH